MLSQEQATSLIQLLNLPEDQKAAALEALTSNEVKEFAVPQVIVLTEQELTTLKNNEYKNGKDKGVEMAVKDAREKLGLEFQGKTIDGLLEAHSKKVLADAKIEPAQKVQELNEDLKRVQSEYNTLKSQLETKEQEALRSATYSSLYREIPTLGEGALPIDKVVKLMEADGYSFVNENGKLVAQLNGEPVKDKLANALAVKDVVSSYAKENNIAPKDKETPKGRGAGDGGGRATFSKQSEVKAHFESQGKSINGQEYVSMIRDIRKTNPEFDMNS